MLQSTTPTDYEELIRVIHERYEEMSKSYQKIALYLTQNPNDVAVLSVGAIAERCGVHASNVVRFAQALGYDEGVRPRLELRGSGKPHLQKRRLRPSAAMAAPLPLSPSVPPIPTTSG